LTALILVGLLLAVAGAQSSSSAIIPNPTVDPCASHSYCMNIAIRTGGQVTTTLPSTSVTCPPTCRFGFDAAICLSEIGTCGYDLTLTESPSAGFAFLGWGGDCASAGTSATCTLAASQSYNVVATFVQSPTLTIVVTGPGSVSTSGITCPPTCSQAYPPGTVLTLTASPSSGAAFGGWSDGCSSAGSSSTCTLTLNADTKVSASFATVTPGTSRLAVQTTGSGAGTVTSSPAGIDCGSTCSAAFRSGTSVVLTAAAASGSRFAGWSQVMCPGTNCQDVCSGSTCTILVNSDKSVSADFEPSTTQQPPPPAAAPAIGDASAPPEKPLYPPPAASIAVSVAGNGSVVTAGSGHGTESARSAHPSSIQCGLSGFDCYATTAPGATVTLRAKPGFGAVFKRWKGACAAAGATCHVSLSASQTVTAVFAPAHGSALAATLSRPALHISWKQSVGRGTLLVTGRLTKPALLRVQLRRPHGGPLLTETTTVAAGRFTHVTRLFPGVLARGARIFPGGMMVVLTGRSGDLPLPFLLQTIVIPSPAEGVTRKVFATSSATSAPARSLPAGSTEAWAHFVFQNQPARQRRLTVSWYWPNGHLLGTVVKANRPTLVSFLKSNVPLPSGGWRAELRAGGKVVSELRVRIG